MPKGQVHELAVFHPNLILETMAEVAYEHEADFGSAPKNLQGVGDWEQISCQLKAKDYQANFNLQQMPGCCAVMILSYVHLCPHSPELFDEVVQMVEDAAYRAGFGSLMMAQVVDAYSRMFWKERPWIKCLAKDRGWVASTPFVNAKSGNLVVYLTKDMGHKKKVAGLEYRE